MFPPTILLKDFAVQRCPHVLVCIYIESRHPWSLRKDGIYRFALQAERLNRLVSCRALAANHILIIKGMYPMNAILFSSLSNALIRFQTSICEYYFCTIVLCG